MDKEDLVEMDNGIVLASVINMDSQPPLMNLISTSDSHSDPSSDDELLPGNTNKAPPIHTSSNKGSTIDKGSFLSVVIVAMLGETSRGLVVPLLWPYLQVVSTFLRVLCS